MVRQSAKMPGKIQKELLLWTSYGQTLSDATHNVRRSRTVQLWKRWQQNKAMRNTAKRTRAMEHTRPKHGENGKAIKKENSQRQEREKREEDCHVIIRPYQDVLCLFTLRQEEHSSPVQPARQRQCPVAG